MCDAVPLCHQLFIRKSNAQRAMIDDEKRHANTYGRQKGVEFHIRINWEKLVWALENVRRPTQSVSHMCVLCLPHLSVRQSVSTAGNWRFRRSDASCEALLFPFIFIYFCVCMCVGINDMMMVMEAEVISISHKNCIYLANTESMKQSQHNEKRGWSVAFNSSIEVMNLGPNSQCSNTNSVCQIIKKEICHCSSIRYA